ncbi:hypothetical protein CRUP_009963, partial [Coryphaenoides rupestris]
MDRSMCSLLLLTIALDSVCASKGFFISAPKVFHVNVKEKVFVQASFGATLYLEDERNGRIVSEKKTILGSRDGVVQTVELMIERNRMSSLDAFRSDPYLLLVAETPKRIRTRVLVSMHRGYLFIQTDQPVYRPSEQAGNRLHVDTQLRRSSGGLSNGFLHIPDVAGVELPQHSQVADSCRKATQMIPGLEKIDSIKDGKGTMVLQASKLKAQLQAQGCNLTDLGQQGATLVMAVSVTEQQNGSAAADVPIEIQVLGMDPVEVTTNQEGEALHLITPTASDAQIVVKVKADNKEQEKVIKRMLSPSQHYLYVSAPSGKLKVGRQFRASFQIIGGVPQDGFVYFLVLSRGELVQQGSLHVAVDGGFKFIQTTAQMMPSCRLIGYYYDQNGVVVSDSVWLDVIDECETKLYSTVSRPRPGENTELTIEVPGEARVALAAVDTAMYSINK